MALKRSSVDGNRVSLGLKCGDCLHFCDGPAFYDKKCVDLGISEKSRAPDCYSPNIYALTKNDPKVFHEIGKFVKELSSTQARILAMILSKQGNAIAKHNLKFGQKVYFCMGDDYVSHYFHGYVLSADKESVYLGAKLNNCETNTTITLTRQSVYTLSEYKKHEAKLIERGRLFMTPEDKRYLTKLPLAELIDTDGKVPHVEQAKDELADYEPPTMDTAPESWFNLYEASRQTKLKKAKKSKDKNRIPTTDYKPLKHTNIGSLKVFEVEKKKKKG